MAEPVLSNPRPRHWAFMGALAFSLAGCSDFGSMSSTDTDMGKIGVLVLHAIEGIGSSESVPRERAAAVPYATLGVRLGSSDESMFVLAGKTGDDLRWVGGPRLAITTRQGRIVQTVGFNRNLTGFQSTAGGAPDSSQENVTSFTYDFAERGRYGVLVKCTEQNLGSEQITIIGVPHDTRHIAEDCEAPQLDWSFRNEFWTDSSGFIWKSQQYVSPDLDAFTLETLRPAQ